MKPGITKLKVFLFAGGFAAFSAASLGTVLLIKNSKGVDEDDDPGVKPIINKEQYLVDIDVPFKAIGGANSYSCKYTKEGSPTKYNNTCRLVIITKEPKGGDVNIKYVQSLNKMVKAKDLGKVGKANDHNSYKLMIEKDDIKDVDFKKDGSTEIELVYRSNTAAEQSFGKVKLTHKYEDGYFKGAADSLLVRLKGDAEVHHVGFNTSRCSTTAGDDASGDFKCNVFKTYLKRPGNKYDFVLDASDLMSLKYYPNELVVMKPLKEENVVEGSEVAQKSIDLHNPLTTESYSAKRDMYYKLQMLEGGTEYVAFELIGFVAHKKGASQIPLILREL